jgi:excisionase family DNA binding protein
MDAQSTTRAALLSTAATPHAPLPPAPAAPPAPLPPRREIDPGDFRRKLLSARWDGYDTFTVLQFAEIFSLSRDLAYAAVRSGKVGSIRFGKRYVIPRRIVEELLGF